MARYGHSQLMIPVPVHNGPLSYSPIALVVVARQRATRFRRRAASFMTRRAPFRVFFQKGLERVVFCRSETYCMAFLVPSAMASCVRPGDQGSGARTSADWHVSYSPADSLTTIWLDFSAGQAVANWLGPSDICLDFDDFPPLRLGLTRPAGWLLEIHVNCDWDHPADGGLVTNSRLGVDRGPRYHSIQHSSQGLLYMGCTKPTTTWM